MEEENGMRILSGSSQFAETYYLRTVQHLGKLQYVL